MERSLEAGQRSLPACGWWCRFQGVGQPQGNLRARGTAACPFADRGQGVYLFPLTDVRNWHRVGG